MSNTVAFDLGAAHALATTADVDATQRRALTTIPINTPELAQWATDEAKRVRAMKAALEAERDKGTKPLASVIETIRGWFRAPIAALDEVYAYLTAGVASFQAAERVRAAAALTEATSQVEVQAATTALISKPVGLVMRKTWSAEVVTTPAATAKARDDLREGMRAHCAARYGSDETLREFLTAWSHLEASSVPVTYLFVDQARLNKIAVADKEQFHVPGVRAVVKETAVPR